jgi:hypothetical protein
VSDDEQQPEPAVTWSLPERARTPEQREAAFQKYLARSAPYFAAVAAAGDEPWHAGDIERRRELFFRRYKPTNPTTPMRTP